MNDLQIHRGPDDGGEFFCEDGGIHLAMRRLSIIDLENGKQPMTTPNQRYTIVFNGEIFNAPELREALSKEGVQFQTDHSDTEVLLQMYVKYGASAVNLLNGMFAFVIYDKFCGELFGARDPTGIKPLYYTYKNQRFAFASEIQSLRSLPWVSDSINLQAVADYFSWQAIPSPSSIYKDISKLPAAHFFRYNLKTKELQSHRYWQPIFAEDLPCAESELTEYVLVHLKKAVSRWAWSDVPMACSLSGGLDSSSITALLSTDTHRVRTFSLGFDDIPELDERDLARQVARCYETDHHEVVINAEDIQQDIPLMVRQLGEPYAGGLPSWYVFRAMAAKVKVGMSGTGGDEIFGNYGKWLAWETPRGRINACRRHFRNGGSWGVGSHASCYHPNYFPDLRKRSHLFAKEHGESFQETENQVAKLWNQSKENKRNRIAQIDLQTQLPDEFLFMTDRFSMAHSLEMRTPFLDKEFLEKMFKIPSVYRTSVRDPKYLLRQAVAPILPEGLINAPKRGFVLPMKKWLRTTLYKNLKELSDPIFLRKQGLFREDLWQDWVNPDSCRFADRTDQRWTFFLFQQWWVHSHRG